MPHVPLCHCGATHFTQCNQHFFIVTVYIDVPPDTRNMTFRIDQKCGTLYPHRYLSVAFLFTPGPVLLGNSMTGIRQQRKIQSVFVTEQNVLLDRIRADSDHLSAASRKILLSITESTGFPRSPWSIVTWIKEEDYRRATELGQLHAGITIRWQFKCRRNGPFFDPITHNSPFTSKYVVCDPHLPFRFTMASGEPTAPGHILAPASDTGKDTHYRGLPPRLRAPGTSDLT
tara:strand:- start:2873 stop:3562 length:690 start_codon:yes stop_codon:yes gene_type:complete